MMRERIHPGSFGLEIGPFCNPLVPREKDFRKINVDIVNREALQLLAMKSGRSDEIVEAIEEVDVVGDASRLAELLRTNGVNDPLNWIVSSHNFEHLPDPLRFLQDCGDLLTEGGHLMMVIPDQRFIMDRFQPHSTTAQILRASAQPQNAKNEAWALFEQASLRYHLRSADGLSRLAWNASIHADQSLVTNQPLANHYTKLQAQLTADNFQFTGHRWRFTPAVLELLIFDLSQLGLMRLQTVEVHPTQEFDFLVILQRGSGHPVPEPQAAASRLALCCRIEDERAAASGLCQEQRHRLKEQELEIERLRGLLTCSERDKKH